MKLIPRGLCCLLVLISIATTIAHATNTSPQGVIKHVIVIVMENRTPDNLFFADNALVANGGNVRPPGNPPQGPCTLNGVTRSITLNSWQLDSCFDPKHQHISWTDTYNAPPGGGPGALDGACKVVLHTDNCPSPWVGHIPTCPDDRFQWCPEYTYVSFPVSVAAYFQIANQYGFANYMFQSNQGPSFPAHLFLFSGTSLPLRFPDPLGLNRYKWFAANNVIKVQPNDVIGCTALSGERVPLIDDSGSPPPNCQAGSGNPHCYYPCLDHNSLVDVLDHPNPPNSAKSWAYYGWKQGSFFDAPNSVQNVCNPNPAHTMCMNPEWTSNFANKLPNQGAYLGDQSPVITDIENCNLPNVSWVIPDGFWSDHAGHEGHDGGPSFVAAIINAVGNHGLCPGTNENLWQDTVILITWDDWGGWYDHVSPNLPDGPGIGYVLNNNDASWYVHGFRVPLLVVSSYNKHTPNGQQGFTGYVSGPLTGHTCPNYYCHDFGSILSFIEFALGTGGMALGNIDGGDTHSSYADRWVVDIDAQHPYSLSEFFDDFDHPNAFSPIGGVKYQRGCFKVPTGQGCFQGYQPAEPDNDAFED